MCCERRAKPDDVENRRSLSRRGVYSLFARYLSGAQGSLRGIRKPPGRDSVRPPTRLPVSQFRRFAIITGEQRKRFRLIAPRRAACFSSLNSALLKCEKCNTKK